MFRRFEFRNLLNRVDELDEALPPAERITAGTAVPWQEGEPLVRGRIGFAADGERGIELATSGSYDAAIVDLMLPKLDGLALIDRMRASGVRTPVLILSARRSVDDRVSGLQAGGDDYLTKPFGIRELLARMFSVTYLRSFDTTACASSTSPLFTTEISGSKAVLAPLKNGTPTCARMTDGAKPQAATTTTIRVIRIAGPRQAFYRRRV